MAQSSWKESVHQAKCTGCIAHRAFSAPRLQKKARLNQKHTFGAATNWRDYQNIDWQPKKRCNQLKATKIEDLAAAHQYESNISPPAALLCIPTTADSISGVIQEIEEIGVAGAGVVELRLDYVKDLSLEDPEAQIQSLLDASKKAELPAIVTLRPSWEGGCSIVEGLIVLPNPPVRLCNQPGCDLSKFATKKKLFICSGKYTGPEPVRLAILKLASTLHPAYIDIEFLAAEFFFSGTGTVPIGTNVILSHHDYDLTPDDEALDGLVAQMVEAGADIAKIATTARDVSDSLRMLQLAQRSEVPVIAVCMGDKGVPSRLLASKFGSHLTFGCLSGGRGTAPGQFSMKDLLQYRADKQSANSQVFGVIGKPVAHSRSPALHNAALKSAGIDGVYIPYLVDDLQSFLKSFSHSDFKGFSVTIPHKVAAYEAADELDPVAAKIGAINTLVRGPDGRLKGYNTDWSAAIGAIEAELGNARPDCDPEGCSLDFDDVWEEQKTEASDGLSDSTSSPLQGLTVVVVGAGGSGRALAFGAAAKGAKVIVANRNRERAEELCKSLGQGSEAADLESVRSGSVSGDILINTTSIGMQPDVESRPVPKEALTSFKLVFDAVYTPVETALLKDAKSLGKLTVSGLEMFVGQAAQQFELFTGRPAPLEVMRNAVLDSIGR